MAYDHADKIGNQGDVVKHAVLAAVVDSLLKKKPAKFVYAESHAGYPEYTLPRKGEWMDGIRMLSKRIRSNPSPVLKPYAAFLGDNISDFDRYPGSSGLVFRMIRDQAEFELTLYEVNPSACHELAHYFPLAHCRVRREDGINGVKSIKSASLVLVDPPDLDRQQDLVGLLAALKKKHIPFICWTPIDSDQSPDGKDSSTSFFDQTSHARHRVLWKAGKEIKGCQITTSQQFQAITHKVVSALCDLMPGWKLQ
jgi:23S rRNA A2030 N6-methylase RlmJ